jgi:hypothetical protein
VRRLRALVICAGAALLASLVVTSPAGAATLTRLGTPINNVAIDNATYGVSSTGRPVVYVVPLGAGTTTHLHEVDVRTGQTTRTVTLSNAQGARGIGTAPDGTVYVSTFPQGRLFRYFPATGTITDLGQPGPGAQYLFSLAIHPDGTVFVGDYPTGKVFSYHPSRGYRDYGQISADSQYVRGLAVWKGSLFIGLGTQRAHLYGLNVSTGTKYEIALPAPYNAEAEVGQVTVRGDRLYVRLTNSSTLLVYDIYAQAWSTAAGQSLGLDVSPIAPSTQHTVYHVGPSRQLVRFDPVTSTSTTVPAFTDMFSSRGLAWLDLADPAYPGQSLVMIDYIGRLWKYNPTTGNSSVALATIPGEPVVIRSLGRGPDGRIYSSGLGSGGLAYYDPGTGAMSQFQRGTVGQADEMLSVGSQLWLGVYPGANLLRFDPAQPFNYGTNPAVVASMASQQQDRPFGLASAAGRIVVGTVPNYGQVTGAISVYNPANGELFVHRGVSGTRSVVSLVSSGGMVYAATSKWGGLGVAPPAADGTIFAYDPVARTKLWEITPFPGLPAVTELAMSPSGTIWGLTRGKLFEVDPATRQVVRSITVPSENWDTVDHVWSEGQKLAVASDGTVYASVGGNLLRVNPATGTYTQLTNFVAAFVLANDTTLYLARGVDLYRLTLP